MQKLLIAAAAAALALASASSVAATTNGAFFANAGVGQSQYHVGRTDGLGYKLDEKDTAGAVRFGYIWYNTVDFGIEGGYVDLGKVTSRYLSAGTAENGDITAKGWMLGVNGKYHFARDWFLSARGGWLHSKVDATASYSDSTTSQYATGSAHGDGWYAGAGVGYDFSPNFSLSLNYDNYHAKAKTDAGSITGNVGTYMFSAEYRF